MNSEISSIQHRYTNCMQELSHFWNDPSLLWDCNLTEITSDKSELEEEVEFAIVTTAADYYEELIQYLIHDEAQDMVENLIGFCINSPEHGAKALWEKVCERIEKRCNNRCKKT